MCKFWIVPSLIYNEFWFVFRENSTETRVWQKADGSLDSDRPITWKERDELIKSYIARPFKEKPKLKE